MKIIALIATALLLASCGDDAPAMSNEDIVKETKFCKDNGMSAWYFSDNSGVFHYDSTITRIQCRGKRE